MWPDRVRLLVPPDYVEVRVASGWRAQRAAAARLRQLPPGRSVVLKGSRRAVRRVAHHAGIEVTREFIAFPDHDLPAYLIEDDGPLLAFLCTRVLSVPSGSAWMAGPVDGILRTGALVARFGLARRILRPRVVVGQRR